MFRSNLQNLILAVLVLTTLGLPAAAIQGQIAQDEYNVASALYARGQWSEAIGSFKEVIARFPDTEQSAASHFFLGEAMMQQGDFAGAYLAYQSFIRKLPRHQFVPRATFRLGEAAYRLQNFDQAVRLLEAFVLEFPNERLNEFALPYLGELRLKKGEPQLAQRVYETALRAYPDSQLVNKCRLGLAKALQMQGSNDLAARIYQAIVDDVDNPLAGEARLQMGILNFGNQQFDAARQLLRDARVSCTDEESQAEAGYWLGRTEMMTANPAQAVRAFESALDLTGNEPLASAILFDGALAAIQSRQTELADKWLFQLKNTFPEGAWADDALRLRIDIAQRDSRFEDALNLITQFGESYPDSPFMPQVLEARGRIYYQQSRYQESVDTFHELLGTEFGQADGDELNDREIWKYLAGLGLMGMNKLPEAETMLASTSLEGQSNRIRALVEIARATTYSGQQKYEQAISCYRNYLALEPDGADAARARVELTVSLGKTERWDEAAIAFENLQEHHPQREASILETAQYLAESAFAKKQNEFAARWYEVLARPGNPQETIARGLSGLAWIKMQSDDAESALATFERLINEYPDSRFAGEAAMARAKFLDDAKQYQQAAEMYQLVVNRFKESEFAEIAMLRCAYALQQVGGRENLTTAKELLIQYLQLPDKPAAVDEAIYQLGWVYHDLSLAPHGLEKFRTLVEDYPNSKYWPDAAYRLVQHYVQQKNYDEAMPLMARLIKPDAPVEILTRVIFLQGQMAAEKNNWETVTESMRTLVDNTDDRGLYAKANYWLAESLYRQDKFDEAGDLFQRLLEKIKDLDESLAPWIYLRTAQCNCHAEVWSNALILTESAKDQFPHFEVGYEYDFIQGRALAAKGKLDDAITAFQRVVESEKGRGTETAAISQWRIGEAYFHQEDYANAIKAYYRVDSLFAYPKWRAAALMQAGKCQEHLGNWKHAAKLYKQLILDLPTSEFRAAAEERLAFAIRQANSDEDSASTKTRR